MLPFYLVFAYIYTPSPGMHQPGLSAKSPMDFAPHTDTGQAMQGLAHVLDIPASGALSLSPSQGEATRGGER